MFPPRPSHCVVYSLFMSQVAHQAGTYPGFCSMKRLGVFLLPLDGMLVHCKVTPNINFADTHLYIHLGGERQCGSKASCPRTEQSPRPGLKPGLLNLDTGVLTMRPPHLSVVFLPKPFSLTEPYDKSLTYTVSNNIK